MTFSVPPADSRPKTEESSDNNLPLIIGAAAGGVVFIGIIIVVVVVLMRKKRSPQQDSPPEYPKPPFGEDLCPVFFGILYWQVITDTYTHTESE